MIVLVIDVYCTSGEVNCKAADGSIHMHYSLAALVIINLLPPTSRPPVEAGRQFENGTWFLGGGFAEVSSAPTSNRLTLTLWFRTLLPEGLLFQAIGAANSNQFVAVYISDGRLHLASSLAGADAFTVPTVGQYNDGSWHYVVATVFNQTGYIDLDYGKEVVSGNSTFAITMETWNLSSTVHFGGLPSELADIRYASQSLVYLAPWNISGCTMDALM